MRCNKCPARNGDGCRMKNQSQMFADGSLGCRKWAKSIYRFVWKIGITVILMISVSCYSAPTPVIIRQIPQADVSSDMTVDEYMQSSTEWAVEITAYVKELINQIRHKVPYIDLRKGGEE